MAATGHLPADPRAVRDLLRQAGTAFGAGRYDHALALYEEALRRAPDTELAQFGAASCRHAVGDHARAAAMFGALAEAYPDKVVYRYNQGHSLLLDAQYDAAAAILRACAERIDDPHLQGNLGLALVHANPRDPAAGCRLLRIAATALPDDADVQRNCAFIELLTGDFEAGWARHERRGILAEVLARMPQPYWRGESLGGKTLLLWSEQGLGDSLQFVRYLPLVARRAIADGGRVVFQPPAALHRLFAQSFGALAPAVAVLAPDEPLPPFDLHCSLLSLPARMRTTLATVPAATPYLRSDASAAAVWSERLAGIEDLKVGLVWAGDSRQGQGAIFQDADRRRSIDLAQLAPVLAVPGVTFVSLQKGEPAAQARGLAGRGNFLDFTDLLEDFADTAALVAHLDLVITVDTSVCHLAGGASREVWLLNRWDTCWRWMLGRDDSPWYPGLRQFRQTVQGDWTGVVERVARALRERVDATACPSGAAGLPLPNGVRPPTLS